MGLHPLVDLPTHFLMLVLFLSMLLLLTTLGISFFRLCPLSMEWHKSWWAHDKIWIYCRPSQALWHTRTHVHTTVAKQCCVIYDRLGSKEWIVQGVWCRNLPTAACALYLSALSLTLASWAGDLCSQQLALMVDRQIVFDLHRHSRSTGGRQVVDRQMYVRTYVRTDGGIVVW